MIKCITTGLEIPRIVDEFENPALAKGTHKHDWEPSIHVTFTNHVIIYIKAMVAAFEESSGISFSEDSQYLVVLDSKEVMGKLSKRS